MGRKVVQTVIDLMEKRGEVMPRTVIPSNLVIRESVAAPRRKPAGLPTPIQNP
jgi:DNA-binding LacI/PurR family transcriptional regulator